MAKRPTKGATKPAEQAAADKAKTEGPPIDVEALMKSAKFDPKNVIGSVAEFLLQDLRATRELKSWAKMREGEQEALIDRAERQATDIVRQVVLAIAHRGITHMEATIEDKGGWADGCFNFKVNVAMTPEYAEILATRGKGVVQIVFASTKDFEGAMETQADPDQQSLDVDEPLHDPDTGEVLDDDQPVMDQSDAGRDGAGAAQSM